MTTRTSDTTRHRYYVLDVFTDERFGGNPLAVFPDGRGLTSEQMQAIALELNLSETVFVLPPESPGHTCRVRIFTPGAELPFAGHPTVGTAHLLVELGTVKLQNGEAKIVLGEGVGPVPVTVTEGPPRFAELTVAKLPERGADPPSAMAKLLSLSPADLAASPVSPSRGRAACRPCSVPLRDRGHSVARFDSAAWTRRSQALGACGLSVLPRPGRQGSDLPRGSSRRRSASPRTRRPAPRPRRSPAGSARDRGGDGTRRWVIRAGHEMGRRARFGSETICAPASASRCESAAARCSSPRRR
jgi:trans-2,3-dihydro-3-hydroxyanthranilate isomerase